MARHYMERFLLASGSLRRKPWFPVARHRTYERGSFERIMQSFINKRDRCLVSITIMNIDIPMFTIVINRADI